MLVFMVAGFAACGSNQERIYVFNWGFFSDPEALRLFQEEYGIEIRYVNFDSNESMYAQFVDGGGVFDVIVPSEYMIERLITEERIRQLDWSLIPNREHIADRFWGHAHDPNNLYSVPYIWGTFGIVYNVNKIAELGIDEVYSWGILFDERLRDQIYLYFSSRCTMGMALQYLGYSLNSTNVNEINRARDLLIEHSDLVRAFVTDQVITNMIGENAIVATAYNGCARWILDSNPNHNFVNPIEGMQMFLNSMVIPTTAQNPEGAHKFINFMARPDIALMNALYVQYSTTNYTALYMLPDEWRNCPIYWPSDEVLFGRGETLRCIGDFRDVLETAWSQVLVAGN